MMIVYPAAQAIAKNSSVFPKSGFGAYSSTEASRLSQIAPEIAMIDPKSNLLVIVSPRNIPAPMAASSGIVEVITPAWEADVYCKALISKIKYKQGSKSTIARIYFISEVVNFKPMKCFQNSIKTIEAASILPKIILMGPILSRAIFKAIKELAQTRVAPTTAIVPMVLLLRGFFNTVLSC